METMSDNQEPSGNTSDLHERIRKRAEEIYVRNGRAPGRDIENWSEAEQEILAELSKTQSHTAIVVKVNGVEYVGEYQSEGSDGYAPGEIAAGSSVWVRLQGDKMFVRRPNGKELETRIVKKIG